MILQVVSEARSEAGFLPVAAWRERYSRKSARKTSHLNLKFIPIPLHVLYQLGISLVA